MVSMTKIQLVQKLAQVADNAKAISSDNIVYDVVDSYQSLLDIVTK